VRTISGEHNVSFVDWILIVATPRLCVQAVVSECAVCFVAANNSFVVDLGTPNSSVRTGVRTADLCTEYSSQIAGH
jgi:hypothetical protein